MPRINGSVGDGGKNEIHDVAVIQVVLYHTFVQTNFGKRRLYEGMIDGIASPELYKAISTLQQCVGDRVTGRIQPFTPILSRMNKMGLPISLIGLEGIKGTASVFVPDTAPSEIETMARSEITRVELKSPLPKKLAASLSQIVRRINMKTKLYLVLKEVSVTPQGRFEARLRLEMASFVLPMTRRLILSEPDYAPPEVIALVCQQVEDAQGWNAGSDDCLTFQSTVTYASLTNRKEPSPAELKSLGLTQCPSDKLLKAMVQGCISLRDAGALGTPNGKAEHADLTRVASNIDASVAKNLQAASGAATGQNPGRADIDSELTMLSSKFGVPIRALTALISAESDFRQFESNGQPLISPNSKSTAAGLGQVTQDTANHYGENYQRLLTDWKYNLLVSVIIYEAGYNHAWNRNIADLKIRATRAYGMYHDGFEPKQDKKLYERRPRGLVGTAWEARYLSRY